MLLGLIAGAIAWWRTRLGEELYEEFRRRQADRVRRSVDCVEEMMLMHRDVYRWRLDSYLVAELHRRQILARFRWDLTELPTPDCSRCMSSGLSSRERPRGQVPG